MDEYDEFKCWIADSMLNLLKYNVSDNFVNYVISVKKDEDLKKYLKNLLNFKDKEVQKFVSELISKRNKLPQKATVHELPEPDLFYTLKDPHKDKINDKRFQFSDDDKSSEASTKNLRKKKPKHKTLEIGEKKYFLLKGRHLCTCAGKRHKLINNCLECGRIVCEQEGSGPCLYCGELVCSPDERAILNSGTAEASRLFENLLKREMPEGLQEALRQRDMLLDFDKNCARETHVFDDDCDYFKSTNVWLSADVRNDLQTKEDEEYEKKHESRVNKKMTVDLSSMIVKMSMDNNYGPDSGFNISKDDEEDISNIKRMLQSKMPSEDVSKKLNDAWLQELSGSNVSKLNIPSEQWYCLSIKQPYASLLMSGVKRFEGRTWSTSYRGKLWIVSSRKKVEKGEINQLENIYRMIVKDAQFPSSYPLGCVLGYVMLDDCISQNEYRCQYPDGELDDPYVFICGYRFTLPIVFPHYSGNKIYQMDKKILVSLNKYMEEEIGKNQ